MGKIEENKNQTVFDDMLKTYLQHYAEEAYKIYAQRAEDYSLIDDETIFANKKEFKEISNIQKILDSNDVNAITEKSSLLRDKNPCKYFGDMNKGTHNQKVRFVKSLLRTEIEVLRDVMKLHKDYRDNKDIAPLYNQSIDEPAKQYEEPQDIHLFSKMIPTFIDDQKVEKSWGTKNIKRNEAELQIALQILGDRDIRSYTRNDFIDFRSVLMKLPSNIKKIRKFQDKPYREIAKINSKSKQFENIKTNTLNTKLIIISAFFAWAELHQYIDKNYTRKLSIKSNIKNIDKKLPFESHDIDVALPLLYKDSSMYFKNPERIWIPLIGFFNGMRLEEIAQLHIDDIYQKEGIWVFDINTNPNHKGIDKLVKNSQSIRIIPIHPSLVRLGFIDYIKKMKERKHPRPWMQLNHGEHGFGRNTAYWFNKEIKKIEEIKDVDKKTFHGTRHSFIQKAKDAKVDIHIYKAMVGHYESDIDYNTYGKAITPKQMIEEIVKIEYPEISKFFEEYFHTMR